MWQSSGVKNKLLALVRQREKNRLKLQFHVKRIYAEVAIGPEGETSGDHQRVRWILNDMTTQGGGFFAQQSFSPGEELTVRIHEPMSLKIRARVIWSQACSTGRNVISKESYPYRVGIEFNVTNAEEKEKIEHFVTLISESELKLVKK